MRERVVEATVRALQRAETGLPDWVMQRIRDAAARERQPLARQHLQFMLENVAIAGQDSLPLCQDTGLPIFQVRMGRELRLEFDLQEAIAEGVRTATRTVPMRPNAVHPQSRCNSQDNTGLRIPDVIMDYVAGRSLSITAFPKGAGSENMSLVAMLNPADDPFDFIVESVRERAANACPPLFLGIGLGGSFDLSARLAKHALLDMEGREEDEEELALLQRINRLGIGPMGLGGDTTALGLRIKKAYCHTASLPVAINFQCWANRKATEVIL